MPLPAPYGTGPTPMALTADQKAMLQLLLERGQGYEDLAVILGGSSDEVRSRARAALTELAGADPDRNVALTDYLLGQADPIDRADAVRHLKDNPQDLELVTELAQKLRLVAPEADLPRLPGEERQPKPRRARSEREPGPLRKLMPTRRGEDAADRPPRTTLTRRQMQTIVVLASVAVLIVVGVLAITGVFGGGDDGDGAQAAGDTTTSAGTENLTRVPLKAEGGSGASGSAVFGIANQTQPFVDVKLSGLEPLPKSETYVIWLLLTPETGYPLSPIAPCGQGGVDTGCLRDDGTFDSRFPIPSPIIPVITRVQLVDVSSAPTKTVAVAINQALRKQEVVIDRPGTSILQGRIPKAGPPSS
jgi:hypothetical protein